MNGREFWALRDVSNEALEAGLSRLLGAGARVEARVVAHLAEVEERRLHLLAGCSSMYDYCHKRLGLSDYEAFIRIATARVARKYQVVFQMLDRRELNLTAVCEVREFLTAANHREDSEGRGDGGIKGGRDVTAAKNGPARKGSGVGTRRRHIPHDTRRELLARDGFRCAFVGKAGVRCDARAFLEFHHRHPWACGGSDRAENLTLLCRSHNRLLAERDFGRAHIDGVIAEPAIERP